MGGGKRERTIRSTFCRRQYRRHPPPTRLQSHTHFLAFAGPVANSQWHPLAAPIILGLVSRRALLIGLVPTLNNFQPIIVNQ